MLQRKEKCCQQSFILEYVATPLAIIW